MARRLFFVPAVRAGVAELRGEEAKHLSKVLRVERGQIYEISDNEGLYLAEVEEAHKEAVKFRVRETLPVPAEPAHLVLVMALIKFDKLEWILEKATELGAAEIRLFESDRTEPGLEKAAPKRMERWLRILLESSQQSRRARLPVLKPPVGLKHVCALQADRRLFLDESREGNLLRAEPAPAGSRTVALMVGAEGGFTDRERALVIEHGWQAVSMGPLILRAETAALAALAVVRSGILET